uniref:Uncharacterized protein n=2 Tax=Echeneis naucrates TaxID=173247 RepID=A0A665VK23_ECHNA
MVSLKTSGVSGSALDLRSPGSGSNHALATLNTNPMDTENTRHGDHAPLKMKIMTSNVADGKKLSCVLNASLSSHSDTSEDRQGNSNASNRTETHSARLSSSVKRHNQVSHGHQARQREILEHAKDTPAKLMSVHMIIPPDSPRTARKTTRASSDHRARDSTCKGIADPDLGRCDIVFIDKPITECFKEQQRSLLPRRNARKSTRGHTYSEDFCELKTVRTLARRGNCPNPMPEVITLVTPKQILSRPEGLPPVDMPFAGTCRETMSQQMSSEESDESVIPGTGDMVELADSEVDVIVETSQTDQSQSKGQSATPSPAWCLTENKEMDMNTDLEKDATLDSGKSEGESIAQPPFKTDKDNEPEPQGHIPENIQQLVAETENAPTEETDTEVSSDKQNNFEPVLQDNSGPSPVNQVEENVEENEREEVQDKLPQEFQPERQLHDDNFEVIEKSNIMGSPEEPMVKELKIKIPEAVDNAISLDTEGDNEYDVSTKTLDALLKELPPWRRKKGTVVSLPKRLRKSEPVIVGYVNGRPISASDRSLRRRSSSNTTSPNKTPIKSSQTTPNKNSVDAAFTSTVENEDFEGHLPEPHTAQNLNEIPSVIGQVTESSPGTISSSASKVPVQTKQAQKQKRVQKDRGSSPVLSDQPIDSSQSTDSKRQLRSASQKPGGTTLSPHTSNAVISTSSTKPTTTQAPQSLEQLLPLSLSATSDPLITSPSQTAPEQSQESTVPETNIDFNTEKSHPDTTSEELQKNEVQSSFAANQKIVVDNKNEKLQFSDEVESPVRTEMHMPIMPLRNKRGLRKDAEASDIASPKKPNVAPLEDSFAIGADCSSPILEKPTRMPLRSETSKAEMFPQPLTQSPPGDIKKLALRSHRFASPSTSCLGTAGRQIDVATPMRMMPERITKAQVKSPPVSVASVLPHSSAVPGITPRHEPPKQSTNKFYETLTGEENQHLITNLNIKYDRMQKGWVQLDKEGQPAAKYKNKADRQAAIWKSKRRARKPKFSEHQKYSPVQMLFMKGFNLTSICRWFLESTETKSLVIVKKVNTRLPSETQLCFHSSSSASGSSQGVFPSLQAERLKKHLKKFAIASPVKSNPKNQKLIAKALEQEANSIKGKDRREFHSSTQALTKSNSSAEPPVQISESQKHSGKSKNPASARILRKYSNIRGKMQVQQTNVRLKKASKTLKTSSMKRMTTTKTAAKANLKGSLKAQKSALPVSRQMRESAARLDRRKTLVSRKNVKEPVLGRPVKAQSSGRSPRYTTRKVLPKRCSQRLGLPKVSEQNPGDTSRSKIENKKQSEAEKVEVDKPTVNKMHAVKIPTKELSQTTMAEVKITENSVETAQQSTSPDQVLTRSQRKMEAAVPLGGSPNLASKRATKSPKTRKASLKSAKKAERPTLTRRSALKPPAKTRQAVLLPRGAKKSATKRAQELLETPAKRTRTSR